MESPPEERKLFSFLDNLGILTQTYRHAPVYTVADAQEHCSHIPGGHSKNLFVRDKKKQRALAVVDDSLTVDLNALAGKIGFNRLSFCSTDSLQSMLGVLPGSVTPFALVNAQVPKGGKPALTVVLDKTLMSHEIVNFHPLHNAATTAIKPADLVIFIRACGYEPVLLDIIPTNLDKF
ncbi:prolyl-tRNA synthetase associated domain-containing protein [Kordiimonas pumila]|uniref:Prolyl-tRNA synthetase associated domain-containing protein n=1 Tax=Kordiimonas pumila TaxID=2161677 RepID=A0ABV7D4W3_9PROT|nr:prolyl-tRNA synthetase associated domain-containing protein [Kordiimonas pumila]